ncbi:MAG: hypothetical protein R6U20_14015 [Longimonas sp.]|uniref:hypothetical protein n=1 Tax=Longimonas sp. TaxID=2039626 RepID=UPI003974EFED
MATSLDSSTVTRWLTRAAWAIPILLVGLSVHQVWSGLALRDTLQRGTPAEAEITEVFSSDRAEIKYDYVSLRIPMDDGTVITRERMSLPHTLIGVVEDRETIDVRVQPGASQEVVITEIANTQWRIALLNAGMSLVLGLLVAGGLAWWSRTLRTEGDPSTRGVDTPDPSHPARQVSS